MLRTPKMRQLQQQPPLKLTQLPQVLINESYLPNHQRWTFSNRWTKIFLQPSSQEKPAQHWNKPRCRDTKKLNPGHPSRDEPTPNGTGENPNTRKQIDGLEDSVNQIKNTLSNLNKGQSSTNNKLDKLINLIQNLPSLADTGDTMEENHQEEPSDTTEEDHHEEPNPPNPREKNKQPIQTPKTPQDKHTNPYLKRLQSKYNSATPPTIRNKWCWLFNTTQEA